MVFQEMLIQYAQRQCLRGKLTDSSPRGSCSTTADERLEPQLGIQPRCKRIRSGKCVFVSVGNEPL